MARTDFSTMPCPVARTMAVLGERWAMLILREAFYGATRFDQFERGLGIAPNILSARLRDMVAHGLLERVPGPGARHEYRLTEKSRDFFPAYVALKRWGDRWMTDAGGPLIRLEEASSGQEVVSPPLLGAGGQPLRPEEVVVLPGPGAPESLRRRLLRRQEALRPDSGPGTMGPQEAKPSQPAERPAAALATAPVAAATVVPGATTSPAPAKPSRRGRTASPGRRQRAMTQADPEPQPDE